MGHWRIHILFYSILAMIACLFVSRSLLSVTIIIFTAASFFHKSFPGHLKQFTREPVCWGMTLLFLVPLISGAWSGDKGLWLDNLRIKLPLLFLPLAFAGPFSFSAIRWNSIALVFISLILAGSSWSMLHYANNPGMINAGYLKAKTLITPLADDHVRFSWMVYIGIACCAWVYYRNRQHRLSWLLFVAAGWMVLYLHILAARTGLLAFYFSLFIAAFWLLFKKMRRLYGVALLVLLASLPLLAFYLLPSFQNRVRYIKYELTSGDYVHYLPGSNDGVRVISMKAGLNIISEHPGYGVGFGDIITATKTWYGKHYPEMTEADKIYPSSEWLIYGAGAGLGGLALFGFAMILPFFISLRPKILWVILNSTAVLSLSGDIGLEVQYGVFIYSFILLWWWKWLKDEKV